MVGYLADQSGIHDSEPPNSVGCGYGQCERFLRSRRRVERRDGGVVPPSQLIRLVRTSSALLSGPSAASGRKTGAGFVQFRALGTDCRCLLMLFMSRSSD